VRLFNYYQWLSSPQGGGAPALEHAKALLLQTPPEPSFAKKNPSFEGCCMGNRKTCTCGAPFFG
jgi:RNA exonuclease 4